MELRHLRYFVAVAKEENISRAAAALRVSQPGVSQQIRDLESELGLALLTRTGKSVRLTVAGKIFFREASAILLRTTQAVEKTRASLFLEVEIHVGYVPSGTVEILPRALRGFKKPFSPGASRPARSVRGGNATFAPPKEVGCRADAAAAQTAAQPGHETTGTIRTVRPGGKHASVGEIEVNQPGAGGVRALRGISPQRVPTTINTSPRCLLPSAARRASAASTTVGPA